MKRGVDITRIALSRAEIKKLRWISKREPVCEDVLEEDNTAQRLYHRGLIERTYSDRYPYTQPPYGIIEIPHNAFQLSDEGWQYLNRAREQDSERRITRFIAIWGAITGTISLLIEAVQYFQSLR